VSNAFLKSTKYINTVRLNTHFSKLSENAQGLQSCLDKLQSYCDYWGLQVNIKKTKSLVFNNTGRLNATKFTFNGAPN
jgi:hypothetical protein